jgi:hypothetical protein
MTREAKDRLITELAHLRVAIADANGMLGILGAEEAEVQTAADTVQTECARYEKLYRSREKEYKSTLSFIEMVRQLVESQWNKEQSMVLLQGLVSDLPKMIPANVVQPHAVELTGVQNLLQDSLLLSDEVDQTGTRDKLMVVLNELRQDTEVASADDAKKFDNRNRECSAQLAGFRVRAENVRAKIDASKSELTTATENKRIASSQLDLVTGDVDVLSFASTRKEQIISEIEKTFKNRYVTLQNIHSQLSSLLREPRCCMCNSN